jgi:spore maturation protein CgeB
MKVFFIGTRPLDSSGADTMEAHVVAGLRSCGAETLYFPFLSSPLGDRLNRYLELAMTDFGWIRSTPAERLMLRKLARFKPDLVLVLLGNYTSPATIRKVRELTPAPIVCWCQDHMGTMGRQYIIGSRFDYVFAKDQLMVDRFRQFTGMKEVHYLPEACNPEVHRSITPTADDIRRFGCEVTTAATLYYYRSEILESLSDFDIRIWGTLPRYYDGPLRGVTMGKALFGRDKAACFNTAKIVINSLYPLEFGGLNARAFEVAGCGGFQLITHCDAVARHFEPGKEIETFRSLGELREKVGYYLDHEDERRAIAAASQRRAHLEHTYQRRLQQIINIVKLP